MVTATCENNPDVYQLVNKYKVTVPHNKYYVAIKSKLLIHDTRMNLKDIAKSKKTGAKYPYCLILLQEGIQKR